MEIIQLVQNVNKELIFFYFCLRESYKVKRVPQVKIVSGTDINVLNSNPGQTLLGVLRENNIEIFAPCGGNGTCGKCRVMVKGHGIVTSCLFSVNENIEIVLPDKKESEILVTQHAYTKILPLNPGKVSDLVSFPLGIAVDLGTTTIVCYLVNLLTGSVIETLSGTNPQARFGADVISRIQYAGNGEKELKQLQDVIIDFLNEKIKMFAESTGFEAALIVKITIAANNTMLHLLKGVDPAPLALVPFTPVFTGFQYLKAKDMGLKTNEDASVTLLPSLSAYVGADIIAGIASLEPGDKIKKYLFLDVGTNGELALITPDKIWSCATAAGPAFEGANISCGMGAVSGAIKTFDAYGFKVIGNESPSGICGSGLIDLVAVLLEKGIVNVEGNMDEDYVIADETISGGNETLFFKRQDVREMQLAKSAVRSGINILMQEAGMDFSEIDVLFLAGGFGNYINIENAMKIGLLPVELKNKVIPIGNTSGTGSILALKSTMFENNLNEVIAKSVLVELSANENFEMEFAMNMYF
jgi:uncharacterized 2Fe-2S/4Fe-4S cluster protein (DUF4445 family)